PLRPLLDRSGRSSMGRLRLAVFVRELATESPGTGAVGRSDVDSLLWRNIFHAVDPAYLGSCRVVAAASDYADRLQRLVDTETDRFDILADGGKRTPAGERDYPTRPTGHFASF